MNTCPKGLCVSISTAKVQTRTNLESVFILDESLCNLTYTDEGWIRCIRVRADMKGTLTWTERLNIAIDAAKGTEATTK